ncbi:MAG TPA: hypothetical protein VKD91_06810 [Pyrinomonadaceae bacterium]|nr:hypothetical protein [Pyrinomonadaceae bacterium]
MKPATKFTNPRVLCPALLLALMGACLFSPEPRVAEAQTRTPTVVFAVSGNGADASMDAVVLVEGKQLRAPYDSDKENARKNFGEQYFAAGKVYRLIFGGGEAGTVRVDKWSVGCNNIHTQVTTTTSARLGGKVMALATSSGTLGKRPVSRRPPTESERAAVLALMKNIYQQHRTPANLMSAIKVSNLTATDLNGDGQYELVGSFTLASKNKFERDLFLIAKPQGDQFVADFIKFQAYQPPAEGFLSSIDYIEQLDLDGDGVGEVFAQQGGFDGYALLIFQKVPGGWREVHNMIGDAC